MENVLIALVIVIAGIALAVLVVIIAYKSDEKDNLSVKYVLTFNKRTKLFYEDRSDEFKENSDEEIVASNSHPVLDHFNHFCSRECYHISTIYQARKVFNIYLESRKR